MSVDEVFQAGDVLRDGRYGIQRLLRSARDKQVYLARGRELGCEVTVDVFFNNSVMPAGLTVSAWEALGCRLSTARLRPRRLEAAEQISASACVYQSDPRQ
jgi:hypothetical protein